MDVTALARGVVDELRAREPQRSVEFERKRRSYLARFAGVKTPTSSLMVMSNSVVLSISAITFFAASIAS